MSSKWGISIGTLSVHSEAVDFLTWAVPELAAFTFSICTASWLCSVPWTCGQCSVPRRWGEKGSCLGNLLIKAFTSMLKKKARQEHLKGRSGLPHAQQLNSKGLSRTSYPGEGRKFVLLSLLLAF